MRDAVDVFLSAERKGRVRRGRRVRQEPHSAPTTFAMRVGMAPVVTEVTGRKDIVEEECWVST